MDDNKVRTKVIEAIFRLENQKGHLKWSVSQIATAAKISRSLVYYHFGKTKKDILHSCLDEVLLEFYGLTQERRQMRLLDSLLLSHRMYRNNPYYAVFYQKWRHQPSLIAQKYQKIEKLYDEKIKETFPKATSHQRLAIQAFFHGLVTAPYVDQNAIEAALKMLGLDKFTL